jgi:hypothetical protein
MQKGFSTILGIAIGLLVIGGGVYYFYSEQLSIEDINLNNQTSNSSCEITIETIKDSTIYLSDTRILKLNGGIGYITEDSPRQAQIQYTLKEELAMFDDFDNDGLEDSFFVLEKSSEAWNASSQELYYVSGEECKDVKKVKSAEQVYGLQSGENYYVKNIEKIDVAEPYVKLYFANETARYCTIRNIDDLFEHAQDRYRLGVHDQYISCGEINPLTGKSWYFDENNGVKRITSDSMEYFSFIIPEGWEIISNTETEIKLKSEELDISNNDLITIKYINGDHYYNLDAKLGWIDILRKYDDKEGFCFEVTRSIEKDSKVGESPTTPEECINIKDVENKIEGRPVWVGKGRWKTYIINTYNGFISINIQGSGNTSALEELKNTISFPVNYSG